MDASRVEWVLPGFLLRALFVRFSGCADEGPPGPRKPFVRKC